MELAAFVQQWFQKGFLSKPSSSKRSQLSILRIALTRQPRR
jgi:hypothetical protein